MKLGMTRHHLEGPFSFQISIPEEDLQDLQLTVAEMQKLGSLPLGGSQQSQTSCMEK